jgi:hypothetical protein
LLIDIDGVILGVDVILGVTLGVLLIDIEGVKLGDTVIDGVLDGVILGVKLGDTVIDGVLLGVILGDTVIDGVLVGVILGVGVGVAETLFAIITFDTAGPPKLQIIVILKYNVPEIPPIFATPVGVQLLAAVLL